MNKYKLLCCANKEVGVTVIHTFCLMLIVYLGIKLLQNIDINQRIYYSFIEQSKALESHYKRQLYINMNSIDKILNSKMLMYKDSVSKNIQDLIYCENYASSKVWEIIQSLSSDCSIRDFPCEVINKSIGLSNFNNTELFQLIDSSFIGAIQNYFEKVEQIIFDSNEVSLYHEFKEFSCFGNDKLRFSMDLIKEKTQNRNQVELLLYFAILRNELILVQSVMLDYIAHKFMHTFCGLDRFTVVSAPKSNYVLQNENYSTELHLSSSSFYDNELVIDYYINGVNYADNNFGIAEVKIPTKEIGIQKYNVDVFVCDNLTGKKKVIKRQFQYRVGCRSSNVMSKKLNVFYIGVRNPIHIRNSCLDHRNIKIICKGAGLRIENDINDEHYAVVTDTGKCVISLFDVENSITKFEFMAKRIPNPVVTLDTFSGGLIHRLNFISGKRLNLNNEDLDFIFDCKVVSFNIVRLPINEESEIVTNLGPKLQDNSIQLLKKAKVDERFIFEEIKAICKGDVAERELNNLVFTINN